jgi:signal transduction histidine kinase
VAAKSPARKPAALRPKAARTRSTAVRSTSDELAEVCVAARQEMRRASRVLHDEIGSLLAVAGLRLQLLQMDYPEASEGTAELASALEGAMRHTRTLSKELDPSPVSRAGLENSLIDLVKRYREGYGVETELKYTATALIAPEIAEALYLAAADAVGVAAFTAGVRRIKIAAAGSRSVTVRVAFDGNPRGVRAKLAAAELLALHSGLRFVVTTGKGTIVSIQYALRRSSRR